MTVDGAAEAVERLVDAARLWAVKPAGDTEPVIRAACGALVVGLDGPNLVSLASTSFGPIDWNFQDVLKGALAELGQPFDEPGSTGAQIAAVGALARRVLRGDLTPREFASWAHRNIGHEGAPELQTLVELDDLYDGVEGGWVAGTLQSVDGRVIAQAKELAGR